MIRTVERKVLGNITTTMRFFGTWYKFNEEDKVTNSITFDN